MQQQLLHLGGVFAVAPAGGEPLGKAEERHRLPGREILLAHEPAVLPADQGHPAGDRDPEHHAGYRPAQQPEQHLERGAEPGAAAHLRVLADADASPPPVAQPAHQRGPAAVRGVHVDRERLVHQPVGERIVPEPQPGRAERLQRELPVQLAQRGRDVVGGRPVGQVQHRVRHPAPGAPAGEAAQQAGHRAVVGRPEQPEQREPAVPATRSAQQPGQQGEQLQTAGRKLLAGRPRPGHRFAHGHLQVTASVSPLSTRHATAQGCKEGPPVNASRIGTRPA
ncbi:hypothetical protein [Micromonospora sp. NPDC049240]|uniref:hypothetical protein n=1 Tax=Micromonospora sp. NPDC049240 TaxID=3155151 RepID=UPI003408E8EE